MSFSDADVNPVVVRGGAGEFLVLWSCPSCPSALKMTVKSSGSNVIGSPRVILSPPDPATAESSKVLYPRTAVAGEPFRLSISTADRLGGQ